MHFKMQNALAVNMNEPFTRRQILDCSKLKEFADNNFDENGRKLFKRVENTEGKGEIDRCEQFLLFPQCFQKGCFPEASKGVIVWQWVNTFPWEGILRNLSEVERTKLICLIVYKYSKYDILLCY